MKQFSYIKELNLYNYNKTKQNKKRTRLNDFIICSDYSFSCIVFNCSVARVLLLEKIQKSTHSKPAANKNRNSKRKLHKQLSAVNFKQRQLQPRL